MAWILMLLVAHYIGDFILQSDKMAKNKSSSNFYLIEHVLVYGLPLLLGVAAMNFHNLLSPLYVLLNLVAHFATDWVTSRINKRLWEQHRVHDFFVGVGTDQLIHYITLVVTYHYMLGLR